MRLKQLFGLKESLEHVNTNRIKRFLKITQFTVNVGWVIFLYPFTCKTQAPNGQKGRYNICTKQVMQGNFILLYL